MVQQLEILTENVLKFFSISRKKNVLKVTFGQLPIRVKSSTRIPSSGYGLSLVVDAVEKHFRQVG